MNTLPPPVVRRGAPPVIPAERIEEARRLASFGWRFAAIARRLGINERYVARIVRGDARKDV